MSTRNDAGSCIIFVLEALWSFGLNCFLVGQFDARGAMTLDRHTVVMDRPLETRQSC